ncbi:MAG: hypothetical protein ACOC2M_03130 [bacterium]
MYKTADYPLRKYLSLWGYSFPKGVFAVLLFIIIAIYHLNKHLILTPFVFPITIFGIVLSQKTHNQIKTVMKTAGIILLILGIIGLVIFGMQALSDSESFNFLGMEVAVSTANWTPVIVSAVVAIVGLVLTVTGKK